MPSNQEEVSHRAQFHIPVDSVFKDFENHLENIPNNLRLFFSGKFGSGKSYFLEEFFDENKKKYEVIKLYPVNYSTASNQDIFELIKFDILFHLMKNHPDCIAYNPQLSDFVKFQWYLKDKLSIGNIDSSLSLMSSVSALSENNTTISLILPTLISIYKEAKKGYNEFVIKVNNDDDSRANDFMMQILGHQAEYGDEDPITKIIVEALKAIKTKRSPDKEIILLIDDMDRLDPDHLFRILNVFGNHFSPSSGNKLNYANENKFGFSKVILVGDVRNIESVFHHRFGEKADFEGYFSKYYSKSIYHFDIKKILLEQDSFYNNNNKIKDESLLTNINFPTYKNHFRANTFSDEFIKELLIYFLENNQVSFRNINQKRDFPKIEQYLDYLPILKNSRIYRLTIFFIDFFDGKGGLLKALENSKDFNINDNNYFRINLKNLFEEMIALSFHDITNSKDLDKLKHSNETLHCEIDGINIGENIKIFYSLNLTDDIIALKNISKNQNAIEPLPGISFKKLYKRFIEKNF
ncbi:hypothetical protein ABID42_002696 [Arcicella rosea]|uniref:P-loop NTPase fold protein n=1 Tax=Arcicella rosea TaxID=502909 RepID=UPI00345D54B1